MNNSSLTKGLKLMIVCLLNCFLGPFVVHQAFKNQENYFYFPVLIIGLGLLIVAIAYGFFGIKTLVKALLGKRKKRNI